MELRLIVDILEHYMQEMNGDVEVEVDRNDIENVNEYICLL